MQPITALRDTPVNRLFFAINHYVSTGDHLGEGISVAEGPQAPAAPLPNPNDRLRIMLLVNSTDPIDRNDYQKFTSRFNELADSFGTELKTNGHQEQFFVYSFSLAYGQCDALAQALTERPGPLGWGSMKGLIERHFPA